MKKREHKILDHTIISYFLLAILVSLFEDILGTRIDKLIGNVIPDYTIETVVMGKTMDLTVGIGVALAALLAAWLFKLWFRPDFNGCLQKDGLKEGLPVPSARSGRCA